MDSTLEVEQATAALFSGNPLAAESMSRAITQVHSGHQGAWSVLGSALHAQGRFAEAEQAFLQLTELNPAEPMYWMNVGTARRCAGHLEEALYAFARASALGAASADFHYNLALTHIDRHDFESARAVLSEAMALSPEDAEIRFRYAYCCYETLRTEEALQALEGWESLPPPSSEVAASAGHLLMKLGELDRAEPAVRSAAVRPDTDPQALLTLVQVLERTNRLAEARERLDQLSASPAAASMGAELLSMQAQLAQREGRHAQASEAFSRALSSCRDEAMRHFHLYPLAKSLDALGRYDEAWETLRAAHRSQFEYLKLTAPLQVTRGVPALSITYHSADANDVAAWSERSAPPLESSPIFVVAFPRSGTTLLELTLDAHTLLVSMDEQPFLQNALDDMIDQGVEYPHQLSRLTDVQLDGIRERYWQRVRRKVELTPGKRLVDKNPLNMLRLPAIHRLFPNAPVLLAIRHPCDVILSCYMQHFRAPDFAMLCMDPEMLAAGYVRAFEFWYEQHALLSPLSRELRYETLVADFEREMRQIATFLQLPWEDAMLEPGRQAREKRFISTPSYSQVVQPVTDKAVGRWRRYRQYFEPVIPIIKPYLDRWGYEA